MEIEFLLNLQNIHDENVVAVSWDIVSGRVTNKHGGWICALCPDLDQNNHITQIFGDSYGLDLPYQKSRFLKGEFSLSLLRLFYSKMSLL